MAHVQANIAALRAAREKVKTHCLAARIEETKDYLLVIFPPGYFPEGVRVTKARGSFWAHEQALIRMEKAWEDSKL